MLNNHRTQRSPLAGLVLEASRGGTISSVIQDLLHRAVIAFERMSERRKCQKLIRDTRREIARLDEKTLQDIGWPARYEKQNPCIRDYY